MHRRTTTAAGAAASPAAASDEPELLLGLEASSLEVLAKYNSLLEKRRTERQREALFEAVGDLRVAKEEVHWLDETIATLREELWRCQEGKPLVDEEVQAQVARSLAVKGELQRLEEQALEDRVRIQRLLALPQPLRGGDVTITIPTAGGHRPFPMASASAATAAPAGVRGRRRPQGQQEREEDEGQEEEENEAERGESGLPPSANGGETLDSRARRRAEWVAKALKTESDPKVARLLREIQAGMQAIVRAKGAYEAEVRELQRARSLREAEAERALGPVLSELAGSVARMGENEQEAARTVREHVQLLLAEQEYTARALAEHAALAKAREEAQARIRAFKARLAKAIDATEAAIQGKEAMKEEEEEGQGGNGGVEGLREELRAVQRDVADIRKDYEKRRPHMEAKLAKLAAALERGSAALEREKRRYRMDKEGYQNDVRALAREVLRAQRTEEKLRAERRRLAAERRLQEAEGEEGEGEEEGGGEEDEEALEELEELMLELQLLTKKAPPEVFPL